MATLWANRPHLLPTYKRLYRDMAAGDPVALASTVEYQLVGLDRHGTMTWAAPRLFKGRVGRAHLVAVQMDHERFVDRMAVEAPGCPTALTARKTVAVCIWPVGLPCLQYTVWLQARPGHRR